MGSAEWVDADGTKSEGHLRNVSFFFFILILLSYFFLPVGQTWLPLKILLSYRKMKLEPTNRKNESVYFMT
jgi:hypothetical protein